MLKLYACPQTRATRITWMLEELETDYDYIKIDLLKGEGRQPAYLKVNPGGKVPALVMVTCCSPNQRLSVPIWEINTPRLGWFPSREPLPEPITINGVFLC